MRDKGLDILLMATQRYDSSDGGEEKRLATQIIELATRYGRYGYRRITAMLRGRWLQCKLCRALVPNPGAFRGSLDRSRP